MPALDRYHNAVRRALEKDGWTITQDPLRVEHGSRTLVVDLGAEKLIGAEKAQQKIAVEVKTFGGPSPVADLQQAVGQFAMYKAVLAINEPERILYLAVPELALQEIFNEELDVLMLESYIQRIVGFSAVREEIIRWT